MDRRRVSNQDTCNPLPLPGGANGKKGKKSAISFCSGREECSAIIHLFVAAEGPNLVKSQVHFNVKKPRNVQTERKNYRMEIQTDVVVVLVAVAIRSRGVVQIRNTCVILITRFHFTQFANHFMNLSHLFNIRFWKRVLCIFFFLYSQFGSKVVN